MGRHHREARSHGLRCAGSRSLPRQPRLSLAHSCAELPISLHPVESHAMALADSRTVVFALRHRRAPRQARAAQQRPVALVHVAVVVLAAAPFQAGAKKRAALALDALPVELARSLTASWSGGVGPRGRGRGAWGADGKGIARFYGGVDGRGRGCTPAPGDDPCCCEQAANAYASPAIMIARSQRVTVAPQA
jgi:hypothetical protein